MKNIINDESKLQIERNIIFVSTIYDSFEALEETLEKLKINNSKALVTKAKRLFAEEVFKYAIENNIYVDKNRNTEKITVSIN